jgi:hypothetical protein
MAFSKPILKFGEYARSKDNHMFPVKPVKGAGPPTAQDWAKLREYYKKMDQYHDGVRAAVERGEDVTTWPINSGPIADLPRCLAHWAKGPLTLFEILELYPPRRDLVEKVLDTMLAPLAACLAAGKKEEDPVVVDSSRPLSSLSRAGMEALVSPGWYAPSDTEPFPAFDPYIVQSDDEKEILPILKPVGLKRLGHPHVDSPVPWATFAVYSGDDDDSESCASCGVSTIVFSSDGESDKSSEKSVEEESDDDDSEDEITRYVLFSSWYYQ